MFNINGRQYEWASITIVMGGRDVAGIRGITYSSPIEREHLFAKGRNPQAIQSGNIAPQGELRILQSELEGLIKAGKGSIFNLEFDIVVQYGNPSNSDVITLDVIRGAQFTDNSKSMNQNDKFMEISLPFLALEIQYQAA